MWILWNFNCGWWAPVKNQSLSLTSLMSLRICEMKHHQGTHVRRASWMERLLIYWKPDRTGLIQHPGALWAYNTCVMKVIPALITFHTLVCTQSSPYTVYRKNPSVDGWCGVFQDKPYYRKERTLCEGPGRPPQVVTSSLAIPSRVQFSESWKLRVPLGCQ